MKKKKKAVDSKNRGREKERERENKLSSKKRQPVIFLLTLAQLTNNHRPVSNNIVTRLNKDAARLFIFIN